MRIFFQDRKQFSLCLLLFDATVPKKEKKDLIGTILVEL